MSRITTLHCPKVLVSPLDTSIATFSNLGFSAGTLVNSGLSFFGGTLQLGVARAAVNIGPPVAIPGVSLPFSLWVDGVSVFVGATFFGGARFSFAFVQNNGFCQANGATQKNGADMTNGVKIDNAAQLKNGLSISNSGKKSTILISPIHTGRSMGNKTFDIEHPNKKGWRLRHVCVEGPESAVYIRGRLTGSNIIELPDYWDGLVDLDTVTISLTQIGYAQDLITEGVKWGKQVHVKSGNGTTIDCYYSIWANRIGEPLHVEYEGETPADYPGDASLYSVAGYDYDVKGGES